MNKAFFLSIKFLYFSFSGLLRVHPLCGFAPGLFPGCVRRGGRALHSLLQEHQPASRPCLQRRVHGLFPHQGTLVAFCILYNKRFEIKPTKGSAWFNLISKQVSSTQTINGRRRKNFAVCGRNGQAPLYV